MEFSSSISSNDKLLAPSMESNLAKRARPQPSLIPTCQVQGCNKDLSLSKDYYKRHKVCEAHSKTSVVVVNGVQQRFCQQCSRFHGLVEFDEGKRSCRKRLAGHNQRRRKPQFNPHDHLGSASSLLFTGFLPGSFFHLKSNDLSFFKQENAPSPQISEPHGMGSSHPALSLLSGQSSAQMIPIITPPQDSNGQNDSHCTKTVDLVQLSLHLQRVEQQKYFVGQIKPETGVLLPEL